ncbi:SIS domain-containing protein [Beduinella massiliensis]|uniref:SIS domain-containing protein n=1 Tax=Beduinella massiliensis TaxID=1852363 RepID=UPI000C82FE44
MQDMQDLIRRLNQSGKRLSKGHRRIAEYIVEHYDKAVFMTASRLGEKVGVSESTVVRFASALGYEGYPQLQRALQELVRHRLTAVQRFEMASDIDQSEVLRTVLRADMQNIRTTIEDIDTVAFDDVVDRILSARNIYVMGVRAAAPLAQFLGYYLNFIFDNVRIVGESAIDVFEQISRVNEEDMLIGISFPRYSTRTLEAMTFAKARGAQVVALTDGPMSPLHSASTICLTARTDMASFVDSLAAPLSVINALVVAVGLRRRDDLSEHFRLMEGIWDEYRVYLGKDRA